MITPEQIRKKAARRYRAYLRAWMRDETFFPLELRFRKVKAADDYLAVREGVRRLLDGARRTVGHGYCVALKTRNTRAYGRQSYPARIAFEEEDDYLAFLGKQQEAEAFKQAVRQIRAAAPALGAWAEKYPGKVVKHLGIWPELLRVVRYFLEHPRPDRYIRELPIAVPTKFIETHTGILRKLLDAVLPEEAVRREETKFERRYGLRYAEALVRVRVLDRRLQTHLGWPVADLSTPASAFCRLDVGSAHVIITENKMNFLTLPALPDGLGLFGSGFQLAVLGEARWLHDCALYYWGDLDAHGFRILSTLRAEFPHVQAVMMNAATLEAFSAYVHTGTPCPPSQPPHLTPSEQALFARLCRENLRLEQEKISHAYAVERLEEALQSKK